MEQDLKPEPPYEDKEYYSALHSASGSFDVKLWAIPGLFFGIAGLVLNGVNFENFFILKNLFVLFFGTIFLLVLLMQFYKTHFFNISIQKKINKFDLAFSKNKDGELKRIPLESMNPEELQARIIELESELRQDKSSRSPFGIFQKSLITHRITDWMKVCMILAFIAVSFGFVFCVSNLILQII